MTGLDELAWADAPPGPEPSLGEIFCLTFIKDVDDDEALRRMGGLPDTLAVRTPADIAKLHTFDEGYPTVASALRLGSWTVVFEPDGFEGPELVTAVSRGTEAISVLRHDYAAPAFAYAVGGTLVTHFDPTVPAYRYGSDPDLLLPSMLDVGFSLADNDFFDGSIARCLQLAGELTGALPTVEALAGPLPSAHIEPWFSSAPKPPAARPGHEGPVDAVTEVHRLTALHDLTDTPGLAAALSSAPCVVAPTSPLGLHVREWLTESRRASWSLNDHSARHRMTDEDRRRAFDLGWLARALGAALDPAR